MGPPHEGYATILFYAGQLSDPQALGMSFEGEFLPARGAFGNLLDIPFPLIPVFVNGPPVAPVNLTFKLGTNRLTFIRRVHHRLVHYHPRGIIVPRTCPSGGFQFRVQLSFKDGESAEASATMPCPHRVPHPQARSRRREART